MNPSTRTRGNGRKFLTVYPIVVAFLFNLMLPVVSVALPEAAPTAPEPAIAAGDPQHVSFTLEGCRNPSVDLEATGFVCADGDYTTGNLGKTWNELDLVPHRLTSSLGNQAAATTLYTVGIVVDHLESGIPGYDFISVPVVNAAKSHPSCNVTASSLLTATPGIGGTDTSMYRLLDISQDKGTTCVFDYVARLAIGSHKFPGSSLHSNLTNQQLGSAGIGNKDVPIPVKEILPQELNKTMAAARGQEFTWSVTKSADPTSLTFPNTCGPADSRTANVNVTVSWTRSGPSASGDTEITTNIYVTNPAHRSVTVQVTDKIYEGANQSVLLDTATSPAVDVPAGSVDFLILTHTFTYSGSATTFNDVATASYTDTDLGIPVPGETQAVASATTVLGGNAINETALITDTESITGANLLFSVAQPALGSFNGYTAGTQTTGPVQWSYLASGSGSVTFNKTVVVTEPSITSGSLSDTAQAIGAGDAVLASANLSIPITASAQTELTIVKSIPEDGLRPGESVTFTFRIEGPNGYDQNRTITFDYGDQATKSVVVSGLAPGNYTVTEQPTQGWQSGSSNPQVVDLTLPSCSGSAVFGNELVPADLDIDKTSSTPVVNAGDEVNYTITVTNSGAGVAQDVVISDSLPSGISWSESSADCDIVGSTLTCGPIDIPGNSAFSVTLTGVTDAGDCPSIANWASYTSRNAGSGSTESEPTVVTINCPDVAVTKTGSSVVSAGDAVSYSITVENLGDGDAYDVSLTDTLPAVSGGWTLGGPDAGDCELTGLNLTCDFGTLASGASKTITLSATTTAADCGELENTAVVSASNEPASAGGNNQDSHTIQVDCPELAISKDAVESVVSAGEPVAFTIVVTNLGPGNAYDVTLTDALPGGLDWSEDSPACEIAGGTLSCDFGTLAPGASASVTVSAPTTQDDCATLENVAVADASNNPAGPVDDDAQVTIECPGLNIAKTADSGTIIAGEVAAFEVTIWNTGPGKALNVEFSDTLPAGPTWSMEIVQGGAIACASSVSVDPENGAEAQSVSCDLGDLEPSEMADGVIIRFTATTTRDDCGLLDNVAFASASNHEQVSDGAQITVICPELTIEKEADVDVVNIVVDDEGDVVSISPPVVTWTLTYTLVDGPVTNAVITDPIPAFLTYVDGSASDGGVYDAATRTLTWTFAVLSESGSVTFQTTVDGGASGLIENVATIASDQTPEDEGADSITVTEQVVLGPTPTPTPTPKPRVPDTAAGGWPTGMPALPALLIVLFGSSVGALAFANVKAARRRR